MRARGDGFQGVAGLKVSGVRGVEGSRRPSQRDTFEFQISGLGFWIWGFGFQDSNLGFQGSGVSGLGVTLPARHAQLEVPLAHLLKLRFPFTPHLG